MTRAVVSNLSLHDLLVAVSACLRQFFNHDVASLVLYEEEQRRLLRVLALDTPTPGDLLTEGSLLPIEGKGGPSSTHEDGPPLPCPITKVM